MLLLFFPNCFGVYVDIISGSNSPLTSWNDESISEALVETWRKSIMSKELERLLSSQEPNTELKRKRTGSDLQAPKRADRIDFLQSSTGVKDTNQVHPDLTATHWPEFGHGDKHPKDFSALPNSSQSYVSFFAVCNKQSSEFKTPCLLPV